MAADYSKTTFTGRLTKDPELRYTPGGTAVANMTVACNRPPSMVRDGEEADFHNVVVWGKLAENCANYLHKGSRVLVEGRAQNRSYENNEGRKVYVHEYVASTVQFLDPLSQNGTTGQGGDNVPAPAATHAPQGKKSQGTKQRQGQRGQQEQNRFPDPFESDPFAGDPDENDVPF